MPSRFTVSGPQEIRYNLLSPSEFQPKTFIGGHPSIGFAPTAAPPQASYWGITFREEQIHAANIESGNASTWALNNVVDPLIPGEQRFVSLAAGNLMRQQMGEAAPEEDGWKALTNRISPFQNVAGMDRRLTFRDENFDAAKATDEWVAQPSNQRLADLAGAQGWDLPTAMRGARNRDHWVYIQNHILQPAQALETIREWDAQAGTALRWSSALMSTFGNYLLQDPSFAPSVVFMPTSLASTAGLSARAAGAGARATRLAAPVVGGRSAAAVGRGVSRVIEAPAAAHAAMSASLSHRAAVAVELGAYGGLWDSAIQQQRIAESEILFDDPEFQQEWSWAEFGLAVGISGALGFGLAGRGGTNPDRVRRGAVEAAGGSPSSPMSTSLRNVRAQLKHDSAAIRAQRAAVKVVGRDFDSVFHYLDDAILQEAGLHRFQVADTMEALAEATGDATLPAEAVHEVLGALFTEGRRVRKVRDELDGAFGGQMEQAALAEATGRAARELPMGATNEDVLRRAHALVPEELDKLERKLAARAEASRPAADGELPYWKAEAEELVESARRRPLTQEEIDYMGTVGGKLESLGETAPFRGMSSRRKQRYADGSIFNPVRARAVKSPVGKAAAKVLKEQTALRLLTGVERKNAGDRLRRAQAALRKASEKAIRDAEAPLSVRKVRQVQAEYAGKTPETRAEKFEAYDKMSKAIDFNDNALVEDGTMFGRLLSGWGLGRLLRTIATSGTGMDQTIRSTFGVLREIAHEMDPNKLRTGDLNGGSRKVHRTTEHVRHDMDRRVSEVVDSYKKLSDAGKFGHTVRFIAHKRARDAFDKEVILHTNGQKSTDPDVIAMADLWVRHAEEIGDVAERTGQFKKTEKFFPRRWNTAAILGDRQQFIEDMRSHFAKKWRESKDVHFDTLVEMGEAERVLSPQGELVGWKLRGSDDVIRDLKRTDLEEEVRIAYDQMLDSDVVMEGDARRVMNNLTGDDTYTEAKDGRLRRKTTGSPRSEAARRLEETVWENEALHKYLDFDFLGGADGYLRSTGFRVMNTARHQERWGIPGVTMHDALDWLQTRIPESTSPEDRAAWIAGIKTLREKLHLMEGRLPTLIDQTNAFAESVSDVATSAAGALYGSGYGQAILSTEVVMNTLGKVYSPTDIVRRAGHIFRAAMPNQQQREMAQALGLTSRQFRHHVLSRLTGGAVHAGKFHFGIIPKLLLPWMDVFKKAEAGSGRGNTLARGLHAYAANSMTVGGMDYFSHFSRMMHVQTTLDELGRFWKAAEKTADILAASGDHLDAIERQALDAALGRGLSEEAAQNAAAKAKLKEFRSIARKGGFGGNWQVAERLNRAGLLTPEKMAILRRAGQETGALRDTGVMRTLDYNEMMKWTGADKIEDDAFAEALEALTSSIKLTMNKRISEQNVLQTPTSQTSRTWYGRTGLAVTGFARSFYDNNILDTAQMPVHASIALLGMHLFGETVNRITRDVWKGRSIDETLADIEDDPDNFALRTLTNVPLLGAYSMLARPAADALTLNGKRYSVDVGESAAEGALAQGLDLVFDSVHGISPLAEDSEIQSRTWRTAASLMPGYRSWWATGLTQGMKAAGGPDLTLEGTGRNRRAVRRKSQIPTIWDVERGDWQSASPFPTDPKFSFPQE
jgi:hypothetical protein